MIPRELIGTAEMPGGGELRLFRRGDEFSIMLGATELMNSRLSGSEEALATLAAERIRDIAKPRVLIGGLGMGFTLRAALEALPAAAEIVVAELVPAVIMWACGPMAHLFGASLTDPRVRIAEADVRELIDDASGSWDAILLDVDNGPAGLSREANDRLYDQAGIERARTALRPRGLLALWSSAPDKGFAQRLRRAGLAVEEVPVRARGTRGARHIVWIAVNRA